MSLGAWGVLGLEPGASLEEVKSAFRQAVKRYHPDVHPGDAEAASRLKEAVQAYETLLAGPLVFQREVSDKLFGPRGGVQLRQVDYGGPWEDESGGSRWDRVRMRVSRSLQTALLLLVLATPIVTLTIGVAAVMPVVEDHLSKQAVKVDPSRQSEMERVYPYLIVRDRDGHERILVPTPRPSSSESSLSESGH